MGTRLIAKDIDAEDTAVEYMAPVRRGLEAIHFMNKSGAKAAKNYAPGKPNGVFVGSPLITDPQYIRAKGNEAYVQTQVIETRAMTIFSVIRTLDALTGNATQPMFYGTFSSPPADGSGGLTFGVGLYRQTNLTAVASRGTNTTNHQSGAVSLASPAAATWHLIVQEVGVGTAEETRVTSKTNGASSTSNNNLPRYPSRGTFRIGSGYSNYAGHLEIAFCQIHNVLLATSEIDAITADIRAHMARRGIVV